MMGKPDAVRQVTAADAHRLADSLALAFEDDPVMTFLFPDAASRGRRLIRFFRTVLVVQHLPHGQCFTDPDCAGGALWDPPGRWRVTFGQMVRGTPGFVAALGSRIVAGL